MGGHRYQVRMRPSALARRTFDPHTIDDMATRMASAPDLDTFRTRRAAQRACDGCNLAGLYAEYYVHDRRLHPALT